MPDDAGRLFAVDIAERLGITASDWRARVSRDHAPKPDDHVMFGGVTHAVWSEESFTAWLNRPNRRGPRPGRES
jgi:hypothetical protein